MLLRATLFHKTEGANWPVAWHQDRVLPVRSDLPGEGFHNFSRKPDGLYAEAPESVLSQLLTVRIELDGARADNGGLELAPGTHRRVLATAESLRKAIERSQTLLPEIPASGALCLRPLLLHRSCRAAEGQSRRTVHLEFAPADLIGSTLRRV